MHLDLWTLGLQAINAVVLIWLLARFLFRPIRAMIEERRQAAQKLLADAEAARARAEADATEMARQRQGFAETGERILAEAHARAAADAAVQRDEAARSVARLREAGIADLEHERMAMQDALAVQASDLAVTIARRLLTRVPETAVTEAMICDLAERLAMLPMAERNRLSASEMEIVTAAPLSPVQQAACAARLAQALAGQGRGAAEAGAGPAAEPFSSPAPAAPPPSPLSLTISFITDPALLAGVELRGPHTLIRNHWQADLDRIVRELRSDTDHDPRSARVA